MTNRYLNGVCEHIGIAEGHFLRRLTGLVRNPHNENTSVRVLDYTFLKISLPPAFFGPEKYFEPDKFLDLLFDKVKVFCFVQNECTFLELIFLLPQKDKIPRNGIISEISIVYTDFM